MSIYQQLRCLSKQHYWEIYKFDRYWFFSDCQGEDIRYTYFQFIFVHYKWQSFLIFFFQLSPLKHHTIFATKILHPERVSISLQQQNTCTYEL